MKKLNLKKISKFLCLSSIASIPIIASACSTSNSKNLIKASYFSNIGNGKLSSNISLDDILKQSLKTNNGASVYLSSIINESIYNWFLKILNNKNNSNGLTSQKIKKGLELEIKTVKKEYDDLIKNYKNQNKTNWAIKFQQNVLDENYGSSQNYIYEKLANWSKDKFSDFVFDKLFLSIVDSKNQIIRNFNKEQLLTTLYNATINKENQQNNNLKFAFDKNSSLVVDEQTDNLFAKLQSFVFDKYVEYSNPFIVTHAQWDYGSPSNKSSSYFNFNQNQSDQNNQNNKTKAPNKGSYIFPYFSDVNKSNTISNTINKFKDFVSEENAKNNYYEEFSNLNNKSNEIGLKLIPSKFSENSTTYSLVKANSIFDEKEVSFAAASSYLYGVLGNSNAKIASTSSSNQNNSQSFNNKLLTNINDKISKEISLSSSDGFDIISSNFLSSKNLYNNSTNTQNNLTEPNSITEFSESYLKRVFLPETSSTSSTSQNSQTKLFAIDNFIPKNTISNTSNVQIRSTTGQQSSNSTSQESKKNNLSEFLFFRDNTGVKAISVDGAKLLDKATSEKQKKEFAGSIVLYRYLENKIDPNSSFPINLTIELKNFFNTNFNWLMYEFLQKEKDQNLNLNFTKNKELLDAISTYLRDLNFYDATFKANLKMLKAKQTYNKNFGYDVNKNGLASKWNYSFAQNNYSKSFSINKNLLFENALIASTTNTPFDAIDNQSSIQKKMFSEIEKISNIKLLKNDFEGNKYSQKIFLEDKHFNKVLNDILRNGFVTSNILKNKILSEKLKDFYDFNSNSFTTKQSNFNSSLDKALYNFFYSKILTNQEYRWINFEDVDKNNFVENLNSFSTKLWNYNNNKNYVNKINSYNSLYSLLFTINYLLDNNLKNFLDYMKYKIDTKKAFVVWENSINKNINSLIDSNNSNFNTSKSLVNINNQDISTNINNNYFGYYVGLNLKNNSSSNSQSSQARTTQASSDNNLKIEWNLIKNSTIYQTNENLSYYLMTKTKSNNSNLIGFKGLIFEDSTNISNDLKDILFINPKAYNSSSSSILYQFGSLKNIINSIEKLTTIESLSDFVKKIDDALNNKFLFISNIKNNLNLKDLKQKLIKDINLKLKDENLFKQQIEYVGLKNSTNENKPFSLPNNSFNLYGSYVIQLNSQNFANYESLKKALANSEVNEDDLIMNLLVQAASEVQLQNEVIYKSIINDKFDIFDIRIKNAFENDGLNWIKNWKG